MYVWTATAIYPDANMNVIWIYFEVKLIILLDDMHQKISDTCAEASPSRQRMPSNGNSTDSPCSEALSFLIASDTAAGVFGAMVECLRRSITQ